MSLLQSLPLGLSIFQSANACAMDTYMSAEYVLSIFGTPCKNTASSAQQRVGSDDDNFHPGEWEGVAYDKQAAVVASVFR